MNYLWMIWFRAEISCSEGDYLAIAKYLWKEALRQLRKLLLGEIEMVRFHSGQNGLEGVYVLHLSQTRWHKLVRLMTGRASFYRQWTQVRNGCYERSPSETSGSDKTK